MPWAGRPDRLRIAGLDQPVFIERSPRRAGGFTDPNRWYIEDDISGSSTSLAAASPASELRPISSRGQIEPLDPVALGDDRSGGLWAAVGISVQAPG